ncbi:MAG TPA: N-acetyl-alpha-D-glucosaminyl L-malate synthase BshA [Thermoanaerobaculia bacterium]|nr:N-acetyl-alpha-D-glucosaminyl L-malate synthase BshA [Thermoanaerobaculia bacterium]
MRIGISCYPTYGGSGVVASELALAMAEAGDDVHVVSYARPPRLVEERDRVHFHEVRVREYPLFEYPPYSLALATKMVEVAKTYGLDVLHVHYAVPNAVSAVLARQMLAPRPLPVVTTLHGTDVTLIGNDPSYLETTRFGVVQSDEVTAVSEWLRLKTLEQLGIEREISVIPNFVDPLRYRADEERPVPAVRLLVHVSNFRRVKRAGDVVAIFAKVRARVPCRLLMVGDGPEREAAEAGVRSLGLEPAVEWLGNLDRVEDVLRSADLFLLPSRQESFGLAALEALACGVPVVATRAGGLPEVVVDGECGALREVGDVEGMAEAAIRLLEDHELHRRYAAAGRRRALERFDRARVVEQYREVYARAIARRGAASPAGHEL